MSGRDQRRTLDCVVEFVLFVREDGFTALRAVAVPGSEVPEGAAIRPGDTADRDLGIADGPDALAAATPVAAARAAIRALESPAGEERGEAEAGGDGKATAGREAPTRALITAAPPNEPARGNGAVRTGRADPSTNDSWFSDGIPIGDEPSDDEEPPVEDAGASGYGPRRRNAKTEARAASQPVEDSPTASGDSGQAPVAEPPVGTDQVAAPETQRGIAEGAQPAPADAGGEDAEASGEADQQDGGTSSGALFELPPPAPAPASDGSALAEDSIVPSRAVVFTAVGRDLAGARPGETLRLTGQWIEHRRFGVQFAVEDCERRGPTGVRGIRMYLGSGLVRGVGPLLARAITDRFGEATLDVIEHSPGRLAQVYGIGQRRTRWIVESWQAQKQIRELMGVLRGFGVSPLLAEPIHRSFGDESAAVVARDPYSMVGQVEGIGFAVADRIALACGGGLRAPARMEAAVWEVCDVRARQAGHCYLSLEEAVEQGAALTGQEASLVREAAARLSSGRGAQLTPINHPVTGSALVAPRALSRAEQKLASALAVLAAAESDLPEGARRRAAAPDFAPDLHAGQREAVRMALENPVSVITGGPGCGKSHTVRALVEVVRAGGGSVTLAAPTGKAARRLEELTGARAMTVHRLAADFGTDEGGAAEEDALFGARTTLVHMIVVDEASMLDVFLGSRLAAAIPPGTHLVLVGDVDQLPSVGPGNVLADVLDVPAVARTRLTHVFRQGERSTITANAHLIRQGLVPDLRRADFWFEQLEDPAEIARLVVDIAARRLPAKLGVGPDEVQVLSPSRRGAAGTVELCRLLQQRRNPRQDNEPEYWAGSRVFRVGDRVMIARNDYTKGEHGVFNGTLGTLVDLDLKEGRVGVHTDDGEQVDYDFTQLDDLVHAYAVSVHKAQGSEFPHVVAAITMDAPLLLTRSLLYTLVTRARSTVVLVGQQRALRQALETPGARRNTLLSHLLAERMQGVKVL